jgi:hypothetical protein
VGGSLAELNEWTGAGKGPFYVCEFCQVEIEPATLRLYSDNIARFDDEDVPRGVTRKDGDEYTRKVPRRKVALYTVDEGMSALLG